MSRAFYSKEITHFLDQSEDEILGILVANNPFELTDKQRNSWKAQIEILKTSISEFKNGWIIFEYTIPRMGKRVDTVIIINGIIFLLEFKVGSRSYDISAINQVVDYALDLKNFHSESASRLLVPILVATEGDDIIPSTGLLKDGIRNTILCNSNNIKTAIEFVLNQEKPVNLDPQVWANAVYAPTPTIIEAAQALYKGHNVNEISRNDASAINLARTSEAINQIIEYSRLNKKKSICFITGVPGAGKTLAGLNIANERHNFDENEHAVFLSGNHPLVNVLQEALARDESKRTGITKSEALTKARAFIQNIHHFRDDAIATDAAPIEKVVIFDEAQRAWTKEQLEKFMAQKKGKPNFNMSEPEFLISVMDRHSDWAVIVCLIGGGQEINTGEAGLSEWFSSLRKHFSHWRLYLSNNISDIEFISNNSLSEMINSLQYKFIPELHLSVSIRSFRSEKVAGLIKAILDVDRINATKLLHQVIDNYPIVITRDINTAKAWVREKAKGTERYGIIASSGARRLRPHGVWVQNKIDKPANWFLNDMNDVRSSYFLEEVATEFDVQGLELDWTIVCWDADFVSQGNNRALSLIIYTFFAAMLIIGLSANRWSFNKYGEFLKNSGQIGEDLIEKYGYGLVFINMSLLGFLATTYVLVVGGELNGPTIGGILTVVGFGALGKNLKNIVPILAGIFLVGHFSVHDTSSTAALLAALFGTTLAPLCGFYGPVAGIIAGGLHIVLTTNITFLHAGMNLYNNGFSGGFVAALMVPILDKLRRRET